MNTIYKDAQTIISRSIEANLPQAAVYNALKEHEFTGSIYLVAIGKAAWNMAEAAQQALGERIKKGIVITKYGHSQGDIPGIEIMEAAHPLSDENTLKGTGKAIDLVKPLGEGNEVLFLISGGGSALFELPQEGVTLDDIVDINSQLLACGADIVEINVIRKRLSQVKAGRFAELCKPAKVFTVVLSDVLGDRLDSIASGPAAPDRFTIQDAADIVKKYDLKLSPRMQELLALDTPKEISNVETVITGSVKTLCTDAGIIAKELGYTPLVMCSGMNCEAREAGRLIASVAASIDNIEFAPKRPCAIIFGGETVVHLKGKGKGGRNQELALAAAEGIEGLKDTVIFSIGSDGTDGPTDAAGGMVDGDTMRRLAEKGIRLDDVLNNNDAYNALKAIDSLIITGPTGTNVNDISVVLCR